MATLSRVSQALTSLAPLRKNQAPKQRYPTPYPSLSPERRLDEDEPLTSFVKPTKISVDSQTRDNMDELDGDTLLFDPQRIARKRAASAHTGEMRSTKRQKSNHGYRPGEEEDDTDLEGDTLISSTPARKRTPLLIENSHHDGRSMPPPPKPRAGLADMAYTPGRNIVGRGVSDRVPRTSYTSQDSVTDEEEAFTPKTACRREDRSEVNPQFEYDRALRHAQAQELPEDSGVWSVAEKDLFYRLAMRGFEPLVPGHWAMDFKTLPQMLFATSGQEALINPFDKREFRAKHFLRNLFSIASRVRDRSLIGKRAEPCIQRALQQYISWALSDAGLSPEQRPHAMPVHAMVSKRLSENTHDVIRRMSKTLYGLADRYQKTYRVRQSVETQTLNGRASLPLNVAPTYDDAHMPTLIGLMIASSVVAVVTLDSRSSPPDLLTTLPSQQHRQESPTSVSSNSESAPSDPLIDCALPEECGLRVIANFDFSTHDGYDVWDGLAMAICVMRIRKTMLEMAALAECEGQAGRGGIWEKIRRVGRNSSGSDGIDYGQDKEC